MELKQAVVVIHGIGEQQPMDTLRGLVDSVIPDPKTSGKPKFWNKPDRMSNSFELRKLNAPADDAQGQPKTDFYEYYWASSLRDTTLTQVLSWFFRHLFSLPGCIPKRCINLSDSNLSIKQGIALLEAIAQGQQVIIIHPQGHFVKQ